MSQGDSHIFRLCERKAFSGQSPFKRQIHLRVSLGGGFPWALPPPRPQVSLLSRLGSSLLSLCKSSCQDGRRRRLWLGKHFNRQLGGEDHLLQHLARSTSSSRKASKVLHTWGGVLQGGASRLLLRGLLLHVQEGDECHRTLMWIWCRQEWCFWTAMKSRTEGEDYKIQKLASAQTVSNQIYSLFNSFKCYPIGQLNTKTCRFIRQDDAFMTGLLG